MGKRMVGKNTGASWSFESILMYKISDLVGEDVVAEASRLRLKYKTQKIESHWNTESTVNIGKTTVKDHEYKTTNVINLPSQATSLKIKFYQNEEEIKSSKGKGSYYGDQKQITFRQ